MSPLGVLYKAMETLRKKDPSLNEDLKSTRLWTWVGGLR